MNRIGISHVGVYEPRFGLDGPLAHAVGADPSLRFGAPDEDGLTMAWESLSRLGREGEAAAIVLAAPLDGLEPRAFVAHLRATGVLSGSAPVVAVHGATDVADLLGLGASLGEGSVAIVVDHDRSQDPLSTPAGDGAVAVAFGEPLVADIGPVVVASALSFDRWHEADERADRDARFVEERLIAREARDVVDILRKDVDSEAGTFLGVVATGPVRLKDARLARQWDVPSVTIASVAATEPGTHRAGVLRTALELLAAAGPGASIAVVNVGWGASGVLLTAGPEIARAAVVRRASAPDGADAAYGYRSWTMAHRPPYTASPWTSGSELSREAAGLLGLVGSRCTACGSVQFPASPVCEMCTSTETTPHALSRTGSTITHSIDELYGAPDSTVQMVVAGLDGGGQFYGQAVQGIVPWLAIGDPCRLVLRRLHTGSGLPHYYWKVDRND